MNKGQADSVVVSDVRFKLKDIAGIFFCWAIGNSFTITFHKPIVIFNTVEKPLEDGR